MKEELSANLISVKTTTNWGRDKGLIGTLQDSTIFIARNGVAYNPPANAPLPYPIILPNTTTAQRNKACTKPKIEVKYWDTTTHTAHIAVDQVTAALKDFTYEELDDPNKGLD